MPAAPDRGLGAMPPLITVIFQLIKYIFLVLCFAEEEFITPNANSKFYVYTSRAACGVAFITD